MARSDAGKPRMTYVKNVIRYEGEMKCQRPQRIPGQVPHCEDEELPGYGKPPDRGKVTLHTLDWVKMMEEKHGR